MQNRSENAALNWIIVKSFIDLGFSWNPSVFISCFISFLRRSISSYLSKFVFLLEFVLYLWKNLKNWSPIYAGTQRIWSSRICRWYLSADYFSGCIFLLLSKMPKLPCTFEQQNASEKIIHTGKPLYNEIQNMAKTAVYLYIHHINIATIQESLSVYTVLENTSFNAYFISSRVRYHTILLYTASPAQNGHKKWTIGPPLSLFLPPVAVPRPFPFLVMNQQHMKHTSALGK